MAKILIVDDEPEIRGLLEIFFKKKGFETVVGKDGEDALKVADTEKGIDIVILDHRMPKLEGIGVLKELRGKQFKAPVIILTGSFGGEKKMEGASAVFMKPIDLEKLLEKVKELLGMK
ncbi:MAG: response regulator [Candidatus Omnitrophota bacterium]